MPAASKSPKKKLPITSYASGRPRRSNSRPRHQPTGPNYSSDDSSPEPARPSKTKSPTPKKAVGTKTTTHNAANHQSGALFAMRQPASVEASSTRTAADHALKTALTPKIIREDNLRRAAAKEMEKATRMRFQAPPSEDESDVSDDVTINPSQDSMIWNQINDLKALRDKRGRTCY